MSFLPFFFFFTTAVEKHAVFRWAENHEINRENDNRENENKI